MASNNRPIIETVEIDAEIYPGMFDREFQATIVIQGKRITVIVSSDDIVLGQAPPSATGTKGKLRVLLVDTDEKGSLFDLPGEPLGVSRRFRIASGKPW